MVNLTVAVALISAFHIQLFCYSHEYVATKLSRPQTLVNALHAHPSTAHMHTKGHITEPSHDMATSVATVAGKTRTCQVSSFERDDDCRDSGAEDGEDVNSTINCGPNKPIIDILTGRGRVLCYYEQ